MYNNRNSNNRNLLITACVKSAINNANSPLGHNIAYFGNNYVIQVRHTFIMIAILTKLLILHDCVKRNV